MFRQHRAQKSQRRDRAPKIFIAQIPPRHHSRSRGQRGRVAKLLGRMRFERRDVLVVAALLAVLFALLLSRYSDRFFDSFAGKPPSASALPEGGGTEPGQ